MPFKFLSLFCFFGLFSVNLAYARWPAVDPHAENYYSQSPYAFTGNNPVNFVDPDGRDYYRSGNGAVVWQDNDRGSITFDGEKYRNIGTSYSERIDDDLYVNYYQNVAISTSSGAVDAERTVLGDPALAGSLLRRNSPLASGAQQGLMNDMIRQGRRDFIAGSVDLTASSMQSLGDMLSTAGYAASMTGLGAEAGVPLVAVGNAMKYTGTAIDIATDYMSGNVRRATYNVGANIAMYGIGYMGSFVSKPYNSIYNLLLIPYGYALDYGAGTLPTNK
mgnify:CR=1 FL=1